MQYVPFGKTGLQVSRLAMGTMSFGGDADRQTSAALFGRCREVGINLFDCADVYNGGRAEELLGEFIAPCRDQVIVTTKAHFPTGDGPNDRGCSPYHLTRAVEASLRRLKTDRIDVFYLHRFDEAVPLEVSLEAIERLIARGLILHVAISNFSAWQTMDALSIAERRGWSPICAVQPMYNLVKRTAEIEILPMARAKGLAVTPYSPLGGGLLTGKYRDSAREQAWRLVHNNMYSTRYGEPGMFERAASFSDLAESWGLSPVTLAIAWVAAHPAVTCPLIGARNLEQLKPALEAAELSLSAEQYVEISDLMQPPPMATDRNEESSAHTYSNVLRKG